MRLCRMETLPNGIAALVAESQAEGFRFIDRLVADWESGRNRFAHPGESLIAAFAGETLCGICGLNRDPYRPEPGIARLRHLYVTATARGAGIGAAIVRAHLDHARAHFTLVRLRATPKAAPLYEHLGFIPIEDETATHILHL